MLERRLLTDLVIQNLKLTGHPVGDSWAPDVPYGWTDTAASPGSSFVPYVICTPMTTSKIDGPLAFPDSDAWFPYQVTGFGATREQCEWLMDDVREQTDLLRNRYIIGTRHENARWEIVYVDTTVLGGIVRGGPEDLPIFGQTDTFTLFVSEDFIH